LRFIILFVSESRFFGINKLFDGDLLALPINVVSPKLFFDAILFPVETATAYNFLRDYFKRTNAVPILEELPNDIPLAINSSSS
jgi:hypothetical protein